MPEVVVGAPQDHRVLDPDQGLAKLPARLQERRGEGEEEAAAGGGDVEGGALDQRLVGCREGVG